MRYTKIPADTFKQLQMNAAILLSDFDPSDGSFEAEDQIGATTGGINFTATPTYSDMGDDIDNCPKNMLELKKLDNWEAKASGTYVSMTTRAAKSMLGAADIDASDPTHVVPRRNILKSDFTGVWLVGDYSDVNDDENGGFIAIHLINALSTGGFQIKTQDKGKGQFAFEYTAHYSMENQDLVPFELYIKAGSAASVAGQGEEE